MCAVKALRMPQKDEDVTCSFSDSLDFAHPPQVHQKCLSTCLFLPWLMMAIENLQTHKSPRARQT